MFENKKKNYPLECPRQITNQYNEVITTYVPEGTIKMFLTIISHSAYAVNDMRINQCTHIGLTRNKNLTKGMRIDGKYQIEFIEALGTDEVVIYMKEIENNGSYS